MFIGANRCKMPGAALLNLFCCKLRICVSLPRITPDVSCTGRFYYLCVLRPPESSSWQVLWRSTAAHFQTKVGLCEFHNFLCHFNYRVKCCWLILRSVCYRLQNDTGKPIMDKVTFFACQSIAVYSCYILSKYRGIKDCLYSNCATKSQADSDHNEATAYN